MSLPDINAPWPDLGHEAIRQAVIQAIADLSDHLEQLADSFLLGETAADGLGIALTNFGVLMQAVTSQAEQIAALTDRVTALEAAANPTPSP